MQKTFRAALNVIRYKTAVKPLLVPSTIVSANSSRKISQIPNKHQQLFPKLQINQGIQLLDVKQNDRSLDVTFNDQATGSLPFLWLRDNCQCPSCFDNIALGRNFLLNNLNLKVVPTKIELNDNGLKILWSDNHESEFDVGWLYQRAFNSQARENYRKFHRLEKEPWGKDVEIAKFNYDDLMRDDSVLLDWLITMEKMGVALIKHTPNDPDAGTKFISGVGFVRQTHYGLRSPVVIRENSNNIAFTSVKLGLHNDLPQYHHQPGMIFLHTVEQHRGEGGESTISDGVLATNILRRDHPKAFELLTKTNAYFWDKGSANYVGVESDEFYKINKGPLIQLNNENELETMRVNNQVRDSHLDLTPDQVNEFYEAMKLLGDILIENSHSFKMADGDILALDNVRCLHGREKFGSQSSRHLETSYMDWDEALCRRRRILDKMGHI